MINWLIQSEVNIYLNIRTPPHVIYILSIYLSIYSQQLLLCRSSTFLKQNLDGYARNNLLGIPALGRIWDWMSFKFHNFILCYSPSSLGSLKNMLKLGVGWDTG